MKSIRWMGGALVAGLLVGLLAIGIAASLGQVPAARPEGTWEYRTFARDGRFVADEELNSLGQDGWELVALVEETRPTMRFVFKRRKPN